LHFDLLVKPEKGQEREHDDNESDEIDDPVSWLPVPFFPGIITSWEPDCSQVLAHAATAVGNVGGSLARPSEFPFS